MLVLRGCGPKGYPGMPEVSNMPLPAKLLAQGVRDMVRVCDGRMSGTAYGTVVLHVSPEAAAGGLIGLVESGDEIIIDIPGRSITLNVSDEVLAERRAAQEQRATPWTPVDRDRPVSAALRAYASMATSASDGAYRRVP